MTKGIWWNLVKTHENHTTYVVSIQDAVVWKVSPVRESFLCSCVKTKYPRINDDA